MNSTILPLHAASGTIARRAGCALFSPWGFVAVADELLHRGAAVAFPAEDIQQHAVRDLETGGQPFRRRGDEADVGVLVPVDEILFRRLALHRFLAVARGFFRELEIFDDVLRRLRHHPAAVVKTFAPGPAADLVKIPRAQDAGLLAVELAQPREQHGADRHVDADAERVRAADDLEQSLLRELLDEHAIFRQQAGVMQPDAVPQPFLDFRAVRAGELEAFQRVGDRGFFLARADVDAGEILRALRRFQLREMHDIHRRACRSATRLSRVFASGSSEYSCASGTGRSVEVTATVGRPVSRVSSSSKNVVSPSVADIRRKRACGSVSSGTCHATPRSRSA